VYRVGGIIWRSRGYLPHFDTTDAQQHVIFNLNGALEGVMLAGDAAARRNAYDEGLDRGIGDCILRDPACAQIVQDELLRLDGQRYRLLAWCIMPNHVHVVVEPMADLPGTVRRWKSWTAREINRVTGRFGVVWQREYSDRFARNEKHLATMIDYVESNPVAAGLVGLPEDWAWSSAAFRPRARRGPGAPKKSPLHL
jgi:REP element-mobilizing transposase RayT